MAQIFRPSADTWLRMWAAAAAVAALGAVLFLSGFARSAYVTNTHWVHDQPVPFSHAHHVAGLGIDCRYCHTTVEKSARAGLPATEVCMTCHSQEWTGAPVLAPVRQSWANNMPLKWNRVAILPDYVYFNHSIHVNRGVACVTCHGRVDRMPLMWREKPFEMKWCLQCHRDPLPNLGRPQEVTRMEPPQWHEGEQHAFAVAAARRLHINPARLDKCDVCHR